MSIPQKKSLWIKQAAIVVSDSPNIHMLLRELLRSYHWNVADSTSSIEVAVASLRKGGASMVIIDDTLTSPAAKAVRYLMSDPVGIVTPMLCFTLEAHREESLALARIGRPKLVDKPLTPAKFLPGFVSLVKMWESDAYVVMRRATQEFLTGNQAQCLKLLLKLAEHKDTQAMASEALSLHMRRFGKIKEAESVLLNSLRNSPRELGTMLLLADLYLHSSMPRLAHRLLAGARNAYPTSVTVLVDSIQASLMTGQTVEAIDHLFALQKRGYLEEEVNNTLARLLFAEGREIDTESVLNNNKAALKRIQSGWATAEMIPLNATG